MLIGSAALAQEDAPAKLSIRVGKAVAICTTGTIQCPASGGVCDDPSIATPEDSPDGLAFKGRKAGTTTCAAASMGGVGPRRVYRVEVKP